MKNLIFLLFISLSINSFAQEKKLQFGIQIFPNFSTGIETEDIYSEYYKGIETFVFSYSGGLRIDWNFAEKWSFSSGLLFTKNGDKSKLIPNDPKRGFLYDRRYSTRLYYMEVPMLINYNFSNHFCLELGLSPLYNVGGNLMVELGENEYEILKEENRNYFGLNANLGFGCYFGESKRLKLFPFSQLNLLTSNDAFQFIEYVPSKRNLALGLKFVYLFL